MKRLHFYQLPRNIQDRFIQATAGQTLPVPILARQLGRPFPWIWSAASALFLIAFFILLGWGYGELDSDLAIAPSFMFIYYGLSLSGSVFCLLYAIAKYSEARRVPFYLGEYVFPSGLIDATSYNFKLFDIAELQVAEPSGKPGVNLVFQDGTQRHFKTADHAAAEKAVEALLKAKLELTGIDLNATSQDLSRLNPLAEPRFVNPLAPSVPHVVPVPSWTKFSPLMAVAVGASLGLIAGLYRNSSSEAKLYQSAREQNSSAAYKAYLERGGKRPEVASQLLPTAELEEVKKASLSELEQYALQHQTSPVKPAIDAALVEGLLKDLDKSKDTLAALDAFVERHPTHALVKRQVLKARRNVMNGVLTNFADNYANPRNEKLVPFFKKLLNYLAEHGPTVEVRFQRLVPKSVAKADESVKSSPYYRDIMLPSQYFDAKTSEQRADIIYKDLQQRFDAAFPEDALKLKRGKPLNPKDDIPKSPEFPTLFISHSTNMGRGIPNINPHGTFVGVGFVFRGKFVIPGKKNPMNMKYSTWRPPDLLKLRKGKITIPTVYRSMADSAFEGFQGRVLKWLFRKKPKK